MSEVWTNNDGLCDLQRGQTGTSSLIRTTPQTANARNGCTGSGLFNPNTDLTGSWGIGGDFFDWVQELRRTRPNIIIVGDYNIAHREIDIHDPKGNKKSSGFLPEERAWMDKLLENGFTDAFRHLHPDTVQYSWWTFRAGARANNKGWRIDYQTVCGNLAERLTFATQLPDAMHSDHCPVLVVYS